MNCRVALLGTSLAIDSVAAALVGVPGLELLRFECPPAEGLAELQAFALDAVVFDMTAGLPDHPLLDVMMQLGLLLVGFDLETQRMLVFSGESADLSTVDDLLRVLSLREERSGHGTGQVKALDSAAWRAGPGERTAFRPGPAPPPKVVRRRP